VVDHVFLRILNSQLVNICEEMGYAMMRTSYSTMFSEGLDFSTMILEPGGDLIAMQNLNPAMLGQALFSGRWAPTASSRATSSSTTTPTAADPTCRSTC
jgi:N-methylhydantoinase B